MIVHVAVGIHGIRLRYGKFHRVSRPSDKVRLPDRILNAFLTLIIITTVEKKHYKEMQQIVRTCETTELYTGHLREIEY